MWTRAAHLVDEGLVEVGDLDLHVDPLSNRTCGMSWSAHFRLIFDVLRLM